MYVEYNMGEVLLMACAFSSLVSSVGGGIYFFLQEKENSRKEELINEKKAAPYVTAYFECDFKGEDHAKFGDAPDFEKADVSFDTPFKSIIVPKGFKVVTYSKVNKGGVKLTLGGPSDQKCTSVHSLEVTKETGNEITIDTGDCDPSRPGGCEVDLF
jgi:hypothetical protein